jgi:hypothetical protein
MEQKRLDDLSRAVGEARTRRGALLVLVGALAAPVLVLRRPQEVSAGLPIVGCKPPGKKCNKDQRCCTGRCKQNRCQCNPKGRPCWDPLEGALCCSGRCSRGKCQ